MCQRGSGVAESGCSHSVNGQASGARFDIAGKPVDYFQQLFKAMIIVARQSTTQCLSCATRVRVTPSILVQGHSGQAGRVTQAFRGRDERPQIDVRVRHCVLAQRREVRESAKRRLTRV